MKKAKLQQQLKALMIECAKEHKKDNSCCYGDMAKELSGLYLQVEALDFRGVGEAIEHANLLLTAAKY